MEKSKTILKASWKMMLVMMMAIVCMIIASQKADAASGVPINAANFPDNAIRSHISECVDTNSDGALSRKEIDIVTSLHIGGDIGNLKGLERFQNLKELDMRPTIYDIDLRKLPKLRKIDLSSNNRKGNMCVKVVGTHNTLDISRCENLTGVDLQGSFELVNASHNQRLKHIKQMSSDAIKKIDASYSGGIYSQTFKLVGAVNKMTVDLKMVDSLDLNRSEWQNIAVEGEVSEKIDCSHANVINFNADYAAYSGRPDDSSSPYYISFDSCKKLKKATFKYGDMKALRINAPYSSIENIDVDYCRSLRELSIDAGYSKLKEVSAEYCNKARDYVSGVGSLEDVYISAPELKTLRLEYSTAGYFVGEIKGGGTKIYQDYNRYTGYVDWLKSEKIAEVYLRYNGGLDFYVPKGTKVYR